LSPYVEGSFKDPLNTRINPLEEGEVDVERGTKESSPNSNHNQGTSQAVKIQGN